MIHQLDRTLGSSMPAPRPQQASTSGTFERALGRVAASGVRRLKRIIGLVELGSIPALLLVHAPALWLASTALENAIGIAVLLRAQTDAPRHARLVVATIAAWVPSG